jgi:hypothetical protein
VCGGGGRGGGAAKMWQELKDLCAEVRLTENRDSCISRFP